MPSSRAVRYPPLTHAGLFQSAEEGEPMRTAAVAVKRHLDAGVSAEKRTLGVPFYGRKWVAVKPERKELNQPYERFAGYHSYSTLVKEYINRKRWTQHWDESAKAPFLWAPDSSAFISYEDPTSLRRKARFIPEKEVGGVLYWEHSDNYQGFSLTCCMSTFGSRTGLHFDG